MRYALNYFNDQLDAGATAAAPRQGHRIVYVRDGSIDIAGTTLSAGAAVYEADPAVMTAGAAGALLFRWDLGDNSAEAALAKGAGVRSMLRMGREIWSLDIAPGSRWLFRLDMIDNPPAVVADVHTHPGPGIRALLTGTFDVRQPSEDGHAVKPGDPWWESGVEAVISTPSATEASAFLRCMLLPVEYRGRPDTAKWLRHPLRIKSSWTLFVDETVTL